MNDKKAIFSLELQILIEAIKITLLKKHKDKFSELINLPTVNWEKLISMTKYHRIRPILYEAFRIVSFEHKMETILKTFVKKQVIRDLVSTEELGNVLVYFSENDIKVIPFKGVIFSKKLYNKNIYRESSDIDILVKPEQAFKALKLLLDKGYTLISRFSEINLIDDSFISNLIENVENKQILLSKKLPVGITLNIDFHWAIGESLHLYTIDLDELFLNSEIEDFQKRQILMPNSKAIFKMLLNHHGGRGCWVRLKDFCDLILFRSMYSECDLSYLKVWAAEMKMSKNFEVGNAIMENVFYELEECVMVEYKIQQKVFAFWEDSKHFDTFWPKLTFKSIYRQLQDEPLNWPKFIHLSIKFYSLGNKFESKKIIVFPDRFIYLNALFKFLSFLWYRNKT